MKQQASSNGFNIARYPRSLFRFGIPRGGGEPLSNDGTIESVWEATAR